jgi:hypothetical protein
MKLNWSATMWDLRDRYGENPWARPLNRLAFPWFGIPIGLALLVVGLKIVAAEDALGWWLVVCGVGLALGGAIGLLREEILAFGARRRAAQHRPPGA